MVYVKIQMDEKSDSLLVPYSYLISKKIAKLKSRE